MDAWGRKGKGEMPIIGLLPAVFSLECPYFLYVLTMLAHSAGAPLHLQVLIRPSRKSRAGAARHKQAKFNSHTSWMEWNGPTLNFLQQMQNNGRLSRATTSSYTTLAQCWPGSRIGPAANPNLEVSSFNWLELYFARTKGIPLALLPTKRP